MQGGDLPPRSRPLIVAHRGAWADAPQNSMAAVEAAVALGCDMVELDVRCTRDGQLVAVHDARVRGAAVAALSRVQLDSRLPPGGAAELEDMVKACAGRVGLDVELKRGGYEAQALEILRRHLPGDAYVITSFLPAVLTEVRRLVPETRTGLLLRAMRTPRVLDRRMAAARADFVGPQASLARGGVLAWAAHRNVDCFVWTVNEPRWLEAMIADPRVAALITDRPAEALALRRQRHATAA